MSDDHPQLPPARIVTPCDSSDVRCPAGPHRLYGLQIDDGVIWARCDHKVKGPDGRRDRCGAHLHIVSARGISFVLELTAEEAAEYRSRGLSPLALYHALGAIIQLRSQAHPARNKQR